MSSATDDDPASSRGSAPRAARNRGRRRLAGPVADVAIERDVPFVVVPFGTRNHFARDIGLDRDDPLGALRAFTGREHPRRRRPRQRQTLPEQRLFGPLRAARSPPRASPATTRGVRAATRAGTPPSPTRLARRHRSTAGRSTRESSSSRTTHYQLELLSIGERERLDEGRLHLYVAHGWLPSELGRRARRDVHDRRPRGSAQACDRRRAGRARDSARFRSSPARYGFFSRRAESTSRVCGKASSSSGTSSGANQRSSATSSAGSGVPSTIRAVQ